MTLKLKSTKRLFLLKMNTLIYLDGTSIPSTIRHTVWATPCFSHQPIVSCCWGRSQPVGRLKRPH